MNAAAQCKVFEADTSSLPFQAVKSLRSAIDIPDAFQLKDIRVAVQANHSLVGALRASLPCGPNYITYAS